MKIRKLQWHDRSDTYFVANTYLGMYVVNGTRAFLDMRGIVNPKIICDGPNPYECRKRCERHWREFILEHFVEQ